MAIIAVWPLASENTQECLEEGGREDEQSRCNGNELKVPWVKLNNETGFVRC